jgi:Family of unknown function (DUF6455)
MQGELRSSGRRLLGLLAEKWENFWEKRAAVNELAYFDPSELARIAEDLGVSTTELRFLAASDKGAADLLKRRLQTLRIDPTSVDPAVMRDLQLHCAQCESKKLCAHELENKPLAASWPKYCPNEQTLKALTTNRLSPNIFQAARPSIVGSRIGTVMTRCPETNKPISTGIVTDPAGFANFPKVAAQFHCPHCYADHPWDESQAWLADKIEEAMEEVTITVIKIIEI